MNFRRALLQLKKLLPAGELQLDPAVLENYSGDKWFARHLPDAVALPRKTASIEQIMRFAQAHRIPVTARGAGYGYVGGCVPERGGIVLSLERMNRIKEINAGDFVAVAEPGVILKKLQDAVERKGLYYPPDPASRADCSLGGTVATNAGGPRCLKYGVTRDYILGVKVVLADGSSASLGGRTHKNKTGFDLTRLMVGSEGLLAVVTEVTVKLIPLPPYRALLAVGFDSMKTAAQSIRAIFRGGFLPCALEVADEFTLEAARQRTGSEQLHGSRALIMVEADGQEESVRFEARALEKLVRSLRPVFVQRAFGSENCEKLWELRREFSYALRDTGLVKLNNDIVVPRSRLEDLFAFTARLQKKYELPIACFGHAGDGNIHVNVMYDSNWPGVKKRTRGALNELFRQVLAWNGVITGEHGIGLAKKAWWPAATGPELREMHRRVKLSLDPEGILNPGKFV
ncbi:MAG TPA: FAD-linked oxidase C-terminal domain-containing protein [Verrucomicrobiae bacterium]|nr:FAD-linked oxidase C-terminal domain-containing protein [Verrucomicrobiae bacterium]